MYRTLGGWGRKPHKKKTTTQQHPINHKTYTRKQTTSKRMWEKRRKVELGRVGRKCRGHWVNGVGEDKKSGERATRESVGEKKNGEEPE